jgi:hypothetical protein
MLTFYNFKGNVCFKKRRYSKLWLALFFILGRKLMLSKIMLDRQLAEERLHAVRFYGPAEPRVEEAMLNWPNLPSPRIFKLLRDAATEAGVTAGIPSAQAVIRLRQHQKAADVTRNMQLCLF